MNIKDAFPGFSLSGMVSANTAFNMVKVGINKKLGIKVEDFDIVYISATDTIDFVIYNYQDQPKKRFKYGNGAIIAKYFKHVILPQYKAKGNIDFAVANYKKNTLSIYSTKDGVQSCVTNKLN